MIPSAPGTTSVTVNPAGMSDPIRMPGSLAGAGGPCRAPGRRRASPDQVPHRLMRRIRHPHRRQLSGTAELRTHQRIPPIRLHPISGLDRDQRRRHHGAVVPETEELPMQTVAARTGLIAEAQPPGQPRDQLPNHFRPVLKAAPVPGLAAAPRLPRSPRRPSTCARPNQRRRYRPSGPSPHA